MKVDYVYKDSIKVMGYSYRTTTRNGQNLADIPAFWKEYMQNGQMEALHKDHCIKSHDEYGICIEKKDDEIEYIIGVEIDSTSTIPSGYMHIVIAESGYAVFSTAPSDAKNFSKNIQDLWGWIFSVWARETEHSVNETGISYELYDKTCMADTGKVCKICIPIKPVA